MDDKNTVDDTTSDYIISDCPRKKRRRGRATSTIERIHQTTLHRKSLRLEKEKPALFHNVTNYKGEKKRLSTAIEETKRGKKCKMSEDWETWMGETEIKCRIDEEQYICSLPTSNPFQIPVFQMEQSFTDIVKSVEDTDEFKCFPDSFKYLATEKEALVVNVVEECFQGQRGLAFFSNSLALTLGLTNTVVHSHDVTCDVFLLTATQPCVILTFVKSSTTVSAVAEYNLSLAKEASHAMRDFTEQSFNILCEVIDVSTLTPKSLMETIHILQQENRSFYPIERLCMSSEKCHGLLTAVLAVAATTEIPFCLQMEKQLGSSDIKTYKLAKNDKEDGRYLICFTPEQFHIFNYALGQHKTTFVHGSAGTGKTVLALEMAKRLNWDGRSLVICDSEHLRDCINRMKICTAITGRDLQKDESLCKKYKNFVVIHGQLFEDSWSFGEDIEFDWPALLREARKNSTGKLLIFYDTRGKDRMTQKHLKLLNENEQILSDCMILDEVVIELAFEQILTIADFVQINEKPDRKSQNKELLRRLKNSSDLGIHALIRALRRTLQYHLANCLDPQDQQTDVTTVLTPKNKSLLQENMETFINHLIPYDVLEVLCTEDVFTSKDKYRILVSKDMNNVNQKFLEYLQGKSEHAFKTFKKALSATCQGYLTTLLESGCEGPVFLTDRDKKNMRDHYEDVDVTSTVLTKLISSNVLTTNDVRRITTNAGSGSKKDRFLMLILRKPKQMKEDIISAATEQADKSDVFVPTRAYHYIKAKLRRAQFDNDEGLERVVVISGPPGSGKTTLGSHIIKHFEKKGHTALYNLVSVKSAIESGVQTVALFDDTFGHVVFDKARLQELIELFRFMKEKIIAGNVPNVLLILTSRTSVLQNALSYLQEYDFVKQSNIADLSTLLPLTSEEKREILAEHLKHAALSVIPKVDEIVKTADTSSFPLSCRYFVEQDKLHTKAVQFFQDPFRSLLGIFNEFIKTNPSCIEIACKLVKGHGRLKLKSSNMAVFLKEFQCFLLASGDFVYFTHPSFFDAVKYILAKTDPLLVIANCSLTFLYERFQPQTKRSCRIKDMDREGIIRLNKEKHTDELLSRFAKEIGKQNLALVCSHPALDTERNVAVFLDKVREKTSSAMAIQQIKDIYGRSMLYWSTWNKSPEMCKQIMEVSTFSVEEMCLSVLGCCLSGNKDVLSILMDKVSLEDMRKTKVILLPIISVRRELAEEGYIQEIETSGARMAHDACHFNNKQIVEFLIEKGLNVNETDFEKNTILHEAGLSGMYDTVMFLLKKGADLCLQDQHGHTPLHHAAENGNLELVNILLREKKVSSFINIRDFEGQTPLFSACTHERKKIVQELLLKNADVTLKDQNNWTPLLCVSWMGSKSIMNILMKYGADINTQDSQGRSPLHWACIQGHAHIIDTIIDAGGNIDAKDKQGKTALYISSKKGDLEIVQKLVTRGVRVNECSAENKTPLYAAAKKGHKHVVAYLCTNKARVNMKNKGGLRKFPLYTASRKGYSDVVQCLLDYGADVNMRTYTNSSSVHIASIKGHADVLKVLIEHDADLNLTDKMGRSALNKSVLSLYWDFATL